MRWFSPKVSKEVVEEFRAYEQKERISSTRVGCLLVIILMPLGSSLDYFVYRDWFGPFLGLRLLCAAIAAGILLYLPKAGAQANRALQVAVPLLPVIFIAIMIAATDGFRSPYYAGLNLVLLAIGAVLHWTLLESVVAVSLVLVLYVLAGLGEMLLPSGDPQAVVRMNASVWAAEFIFNNFYFILLMDLIVVVGAYVGFQQRLREFVLRRQLNRSQNTLKQSNQKLRELDRIKSRFFANISHELRTPLTLLLTPLESLIASDGKNVSDDGRGLLETMQANGMRLLKLINDLLDLVRLDSGRMAVKREPVSVAELVHGLSASVRQAAEKKRIEIVPDIRISEKPVLLDRDKLEKVLLNLVFNSIKFTGVGGKIRLIADHEGDDLTIEVRDTGAGIPQKSLPFVFDRFWQADASSHRKHQGTGIGLALVKELIEAQGGKVSVASQEGKGTSFRVNLPYLEPAKLAMKASGEHPDAAPTESSAPSANEASHKRNGSDEDGNEWLTQLCRRAELFPVFEANRVSNPSRDTIPRGRLPKVLVADDEPHMRQFLRSRLDRRYQVLEARDGNQALEMAFQFLPQVILLDVMMPGKDGLEVCQELRKRTSTRSIPVVLLTARADEETKLEALEAGANDFLSKPFSTTELFARVKNLVESHGYQQQLTRQNQILESTLEQLKETETQLVQSEKLASLGKLSAGIIHEINNPLNYTRTGLYTLKGFRQNMQGEDRDEFDETLKDISEGMDRVTTIVSDLRGFSHVDASQRREVTIAELVGSAMRLLSNQWKGSVTIEEDVDAGLTIEANANQIVQVLINLLQNAIDSLRKKTFSNGARPIIKISAREAPRRVLLVIRDNGLGISEEALPKIFDPFFTTRDVGEGVGLGLSICYKIIERHGGRVDVRTEEGQYCEFELAFPAVRKSPPKVEKAHS